jgi:CheY-like chemotaxis protein/anti-sigma regulatory factor (Ser/Thr protein kinase)
MNLAMGGRPIELLLVEDNPADVRLIQEVLKDRDLLVTTHVAGDGAEALDWLRTNRMLPDVVLTDLQMPRISGLELVERVRRDYPSVPVVLMTAYGTEDIAMQALQKGAASYVPKKTLYEDLAATLEQILDVAYATRQRHRLLDCLTETQSQFVLDNDPSLIPPLIAHLEDQLDRMMLCDGTGKIRVCVAIREAVLNAITHGNLELDSTVRIEDRTCAQLLEERRGQTPYRDRRVHVVARESRDQAVYVVRDEGPGFDPDQLPDPTDPANLENVSGRGMLLIRTFMDDVYHNEIGNQITMVKRRDASVMSATELQR